MASSEATPSKPTENEPAEAEKLGIGVLYSPSGSKQHIRGKNWTESRNKEGKSGRQPVPRGPVGQDFEFNRASRISKRSDRRQGLYYKIKELNQVTGDHIYIELFKMEEEMEIDLPKLPKGERRAESSLKTRPDLNSKLVLATDMSLHKSSESSKKLCDLNTTTLTPDDMASFSTPSKIATKKRRHIQTVQEQTRKERERKCQKCGGDDNRSTWLGCDGRLSSGESCEY